MRSRIQKWGNSLAVRIPKAYASEAGLREDTVVELAVQDGKLVVTPEPVTLEALVAGITPDNVHSEADFGPSQGREVW